MSTVKVLGSGGKGEGEGFMHFQNENGFMKKLSRLALPIAGQNIIDFSLAFLDNMMISRTGDIATAGVYIGAELFRFFRYFSVGIEGAVARLCPKYLGQGKLADAKKASLFGTAANCAVGVMLTFVCFFAVVPFLSLFTENSEILNTGAEYMRAVALSYPLFALSRIIITTERCEGRGAVGLISSTAALGVNLLLGFWLIGRFGVRGAGIATVGARACELLCAIGCSLIFKRLKKPSAADAASIKSEYEEGNADKGNASKASESNANKSKASDGNATRGNARKIKTSANDALECTPTQFVKTALPTVLAQLIWAINMLGGTLIIGSLGSDSALGGLAVATGAYNLFLAPLSGAVSALAIIVSRADGQGDRATVNEAIRVCRRYFPLLGILTAGLMMLLRGGVLALYSAEGEVASVGNGMIGALAVFLPFAFLENTLLYGIGRGVGRLKLILYCDLIAVIGITLPSAILASSVGASAIAVYSILRAELILKCVPALTVARQIERSSHRSKP